VAARRGTCGNRDGTAFPNMERPSAEKAFGISPYVVHPQRRGAQLFSPGVTGKGDTHLIPILWIVIRCKSPLGQGARLTPPFKLCRQIPCRNRVGTLPGDFEKSLELQEVLFVDMPDQPRQGHGKA